uniref:PKD domain-containing protein n=1 Tax=Portibacter marinus TaxID=2898660 RepID=UPI0029E80633
MNVLLPFKSLILNCILFCCFSFLIIQPTFSQAIEHPCYDKPNCTSNDFTLESAFLAKDINGTMLTSSDCDNRPVETFICVNIQNSTSSARTGIYVAGTFESGGFTENIEHCFPNNMPANSLITLCAPSPDTYTWQCDDEVLLSDYLTAWSVGNDSVCVADLATTDPNDFIIACGATTKAKCQNEPTEPIVVTIPIVANFSFACTDGVSLGVSFMDETVGGSMNYTSYLWAFDDGNTSNLPDPMHTYTSAGIYDVTLTVTDDEGDSDDIVIEVNAGACCALSVNNTTLNQCADNNGTATFNLTLAEPSISNAQGVSFAYYSNSQLSSLIANPGSYSITSSSTIYVEVTDASECTAVAEVLLNITGSCCLPPVISCPPDKTIECDESTNPSNTGEATFIEGCGEVTITFIDSETEGSCPSEKTITRTWKAEDQDGNIDLCDQIISVEDNMVPVLASAPANITVECADDVPPMTSLGWTDNCDGSGTVLGIDGPQSGGNCGGTITRTWNYTDMCGNAAMTRTQVITIDDMIFPVLDQAPSNITVQCADDVPSPSDLGWTDNCDGSGTVTSVDSPQSGGDCGGTITRSWNYTDMCGNDAVERIQIITINDTTDPEFEAAPGPVSYQCQDDVPAPGNLTWTDNCDGTGSVTGVDGPLVGGPCGGTITRTWTYTDACLNIGTATQIITINDTTDPEFEAAPGPVSYQC